MRRAAREAIAEMPRFHPDRANDDAAIADAVRLAVRRAFHRALGFKPVTAVEVVRVST